MALLSPGDVFHRLVQRLPAGPAGVLWNVTYVFAWVTLPYSVYGAIRDLAFVLHYATILGSRLPEMLLGAARWILTQVDATLALWRSITGPIREWLATQPIPFAEQLADIAVVPLLLLPSLVRYVLHRGIYLAEDVAARVTRSEAELAARRAAEAAAARADAQSDNVSGGIASGVAVGAVVGGPVGAVIGGIIGAIAGAMASDDADSDQPGSAAAAEAEERARRAALARRRYGQSRTILIASLIGAALVTALITVNWHVAPRIGADAPCRTVRAAGETCWCFPGAPDGLSAPAPDGGRNYCLARR
ncbi:hypothetical protein L2D01_01230 [Hyphomonadaceae bacterium ML37]|nr:hypothetical protein L2D01_01230 [Hyphomonadaceae bacterium ML37]